MSRLARLHCLTCGHETLHERDSCVHCARVYRVPPGNQRAVRKVWAKRKRLPLPDRWHAEASANAKADGAPTTRTTAVNPAAEAP